MKVTSLQDEIVLAEVSGSYFFLMREKESYILSHRQNALSLKGDDSDVDIKGLPQADIL